MLAELEKLNRKLHKVVIFDGSCLTKTSAENDPPAYELKEATETITVEVHGLTAMERRHLQEIITRVTPPRKLGISGQPSTEEPFDYEDPAYIHEQKKNALLQQACATIYGTPSLAEDLNLGSTRKPDEIERAANTLLERLAEETVSSLSNHILNIGHIGVTHDFFLKASSPPTQS